MITLPAILDVPDKLRPIITELDKYRFFLIEGGRTSGKSNTIARLILYLGEQYALRTVCGREIWSTIDESVYTLLADLIKKYNLDYDVRAQEINHRSSGTAIKFRGFREQGAVSIKGMEATDVLWVDEGEALQADTLKILIPTIIRNPKAKIFITMNRYLDDDPAYAMLHNRPDCLHIHIDYFDNKWCPESSKAEAETCKATNADDYKHIWLGEPLAQANNAAFRNVVDIVRDYVVPIGYNPEFNYVLGADLARSVDYTVLTVINKQLKRVDYVERMENENRTSWSYQKEKILAVSRMYGNAMTIVDSTGVGDPIVEDLQRMGCNVYYNETEAGKTTPGVKFTAASKENLIEKLKIAIELKLFTIPRVPWLIRELERFECITLPSGNHRWQARDGEHDDGVMSLALAVWGARDFIYAPQYESPKKVTPTDEFWGRVKADLKKRDFGLTEDAERDISEDTEILVE